MLDELVRGFGHGFGHKDHRSSGHSFQEHKQFMSHEESHGGHFDRQAQFDRHMRLPVNHGRPPMAHMSVCEEDDSDSDVEEFFESRQSHHSNNHHKQPPHMNFMPPSPMVQPHHNGKMGNGWHGGDGMQHHGGHGMEHHGHGMQHHGGHEMQHHSPQHHSGMEHHGGHGMQHHSSQHHGGMKHQDKLMAPQVPPHHVFMNPGHGSGNGQAVVVKATENWRVSNHSGGHRKAGWGSKGL